MTETIKVAHCLLCSTLNRPAPRQPMANAMLATVDSGVAAPPTS